MTNKVAKKLHEDGVSLFRNGKLEEARQKFDEALQQAPAGTRQVAEIYNDLGVIYTQLEDYDAADEALDEAMSQFSTLDDEKGKAQTLGNRGALLDAAGLTEEAVAAYKESATIFEALGENDMAMYVWQAISKLRMKQKQYIAAIGAYEEGVENMPEGSFKRKMLQKLLKAPGAFLGGSSGSSQDDDAAGQEE